MRELSKEGQAAVSELARKHGFGQDAVQNMLRAVVAGNGGMAQFDHSEFGGSGQWMRGGMIMISDMFNNSLKARIDGLCSDLAALVAGQPDLLASGSHQSQSQRHGGFSSHHGGQQQSQGGGSQSSSFGGAQGTSLFVPGAAGGSSHWWGADLGQPGSTGAQNNIRYAWFPAQRRLAIEAGGKVTVYDTLDHQIGGFSQQQSQGASLTFTSQHGLVDVSSLPVVSGDSERSQTGRESAPEASTQRTSPSAQPAETRPRSTGHNADTDVFAAIEKLAALHGKGILTDEEFAAKKAELLGRL